MRDAIDFALADRERRYDSWIAHLPKCDKCGNPIEDDHLWEIEGGWYCEECAKDLFRFPIENYTDY